MSSDTKATTIDIEQRIILQEPHQTAFWDAVDSHQITVLFGGRQCGKGEVAAAKFVNLISTTPARSGINWVIAPSYNQTRRCERQFLQYAGDLVLMHRKSEKAYILRPTLANPDKFIRVEFKTGNDPVMLRGDAVDILWQAEFVYNGEAVYDVTLPCIMTTNGKMLLESTPRNLKWIREKIVQKAIDYPDRYAIIRGRSEDNIWADEILLDTIRNSYTPEQVRQELEGELVEITGVVFPMFDIDRHVIGDISPDEFEGGKVFSGLDFGFHDPTVNLWMGYKNGIFYILDEHYERRLPYAEHAEIILNSDIHTFNKILGGRRWSDPSNSQGRIEMQRYGVPSTPALRAGAERRQWVQARISLITRLLNLDLLKICRRCVNTIMEFESYAYPTKRNIDTANELPVSAFDHSIDACGYAIYSETSGGRTLNFTRDDDGKLIISPNTNAVSSIDRIYNRLAGLNLIGGAGNRDISNKEKVKSIWA